MAKPELKQFGDLTRKDFERCPVWIGCHTADYDEPWYDDTDEETFRPWTGALPADASQGMLLVRATFEPKTKNSKRTLALGALVDRYDAWIKAKNIKSQGFSGLLRVIGQRLRVTCSAN